MNASSAYWQTLPITHLRNEAGYTEIGVDCEYVSVFSTRVMPPGSLAQPGWYRDDKEDEALPEGQFATTRHQYRSTFLEKLINEMGRRGWLAKILATIQSDKMMELSPYLGCVITNIEPMLTRRFAADYLRAVEKAVLSNLLSANETALRVLTKFKIDRLLIQMSTLRKAYLPITVRKFLFYLETLEVCLLCFRSSFLERKLQGLGVINEVVKASRCQSYEVREKQAYLGPCSLQDEYSEAGLSEQGAMRNNSLTSAFVCRWVCANRVLEQIYVPSSHVQVLQRASELVVCLATEGQLPSSALALMWACSRKADPESKEAIYSTFQEINRYEANFDRGLLLDLLYKVEPLRISPEDVTLIYDVACTSVEEEDIRRGVIFLWRVIAAQLSSHPRPKESELIALLIKKIVQSLNSFYASQIKS